MYVDKTTLNQPLWVKTLYTCLLTFLQGKTTFLQIKQPLFRQKQPLR